MQDRAQKIDRRPRTSSIRRDRVTCPFADVIATGGSFSRFSITANLARERMQRKARIILGIPAVHLVDQVLCEFDEASGFTQASTKARPVAGMGILDDIPPTIRKPRPEVAKAGNLLVHFVPAVIDDQVKRAMLLSDPVQDGRVSLIPDLDPGPRKFQRSASRIDVQKRQP
jgi:hypothetical protein